MSRGSKAAIECAAEINEAINRMIAECADDTDRVQATTHLAHQLVSSGSLVVRVVRVLRWSALLNLSALGFSAREISEATGMPEETTYMSRVRVQQELTAAREWFGSGQTARKPRAVPISEPDQDAA